MGAQGCGVVQLAEWSGRLRPRLSCRIDAPKPLPAERTASHALKAPTWAVSFLEIFNILHHFHHAAPVYGLLIMFKFSLRSTLRQIRPSSRVIKIFVIFFLLYGIYIVYDRYTYERLLDRLYITFDDFPKDYARALSALPDDKPIKSYDYSTSFPPGHEPPNTIPSIIHFIWYKDLYETHKDVTNIPSMGSHAPELCQQHNPDFQVNIWNATAGRDLLETHYKWFLPIYDGYTHPIQRVDAIKYFILLHHGGFYLDLDIACRRSLAPIQPFPAWVPRARPLGLNNDALAFRPKHPAMEKMTKTLKPRNKNLIFPYLTIFWSTGPQFTTDVLKLWFDEQYRAGREFYVPGSSKMPSGECGIF